MLDILTMKTLSTKQWYMYEIDGFSLHELKSYFCYKQIKHYLILLLWGFTLSTEKAQVVFFLITHLAE
jgi:hypothetical protein